MKYIICLSAVLILIMLQKNAFILIGVFLLWYAYIQIVIGQRLPSYWFSDMHKWSKYYDSLYDNPILTEIEREYIKVSNDLHDIDYRILSDIHYRKPKKLTRAILNKYGILDDFNKLKAQKEKLKTDYLMTEKLIGIDIFPERDCVTIRTLKNRNTKSTGGIFTII